MGAAVVMRRAAQGFAMMLGLLVVGTDVLTVLLDSVTHFAGTGGPVVDTVNTAAATMPAALVATLLAVRRPRNPIGWLLFVIIYLAESPTQEYTIYAYRTHPGALPLAWVMVVLEECWPLFLVSVAILLWVFPDGTLPGGRWRWPARTLLVTGVALAVVASLPGALPVIHHAVRLKANGDLVQGYGGAFKVFEGAVIVGVLLSWLAWIAVQFPVYRRAGGERRQQLKWLYSGGGMFAIALIFGVFVIPLAMGQTAGWGSSPAVSVILTLGFGALPVCMGVAVLKYRLYELDRIISRVVSYALVTALLIGVYAGLVLLAAHVLAHKSAVGVAVSTLITAALFNPVRRRVQRVVDRRFNRSRYDAEALVAAFTGRLRQTVDFDTVRDDLVGVVDRAFQPTQVSMWLSLADGEARLFEQGLEVGQEARPAL